MRKKMTFRIVACVLAATMMLPVSAASSPNLDEATGTYKVLGTDRELDYDRYQEIESELNEIDRLMKSVSSVAMEEDTAMMIQRYANQVSLIERRDALIDELGEIGALLTPEQLAQLPAPTSNTITASLDSVDDTELTGSLKELAEYYENWFVFTGYESVVMLGNEQYRTCVVKVRDLPNISTQEALLNLEYVDINIIDDEIAADANDFAEMLTTVVKFVDSFDVSDSVSYALNEVCLPLIEAINSGTIEINYSDSIRYTTDLTLSTHLYYGYTWNENSNDWVYCMSSSYVYPSDANIVRYTIIDENGIARRQVQVLDSNFPNESYHFGDYTVDDMCEMAAAVYMGAGETTPSFTPSYQIQEIDIKLKWKGVGSFTDVDYTDSFYAIVCERPGDLWTLNRGN